MKFIKGMHTYKNEYGYYRIKYSKLYIWEIPKNLEKENISQGDIVLAICKNSVAPIMVLSVFESNDEKIKHKKVIKILDKMIKN